MLVLISPLSAKLRTSPNNHFFHQYFLGQRKKNMTKGKRTKYQLLGLVSLSLIIAAATYGFAAVNSVNSAGILGVGYGVMSNYQVNNISYTLDEANPTTFTAVDFEVDQLGGSLIAGVSSTKRGQVVWADDCQTNGTKWTCTFNGSIDVLAADWLHVLAVE